MANKEKLSQLRAGTKINNTSEKREGKAHAALNDVILYIHQLFPGIHILHEREWHLNSLVDHLSQNFPETKFSHAFHTSKMRPDGGVLCLIDRKNKKFPILITEMKNQGTNDVREKEGEKRQAKGNAIERLGKNVIGFRMALLTEEIFPFVCFGDGCDFAKDSSILDRVSTIAMFAIHLYNEGPNKQLNRGSFFFREKFWSAKEISKIMKEISEKAIEYYLEKYGRENFIMSPGRASVTLS